MAFAKNASSLLGGSGGLFTSSARIYRQQGSFKPWEPSSVQLKMNQLCRAITMPQTNTMLQSQQITPPKPKKMHDVEHSDIGSEYLFGDSNLLAFTPTMRTANNYGANRSWIPASGVIFTTCLPAVFTDIGQQARACPQMCQKAQIKYIEKLMISGKTAAGRVSDLVANSDEICAVIGSQKGVSFDGMYDMNKFVDKMYHVIGTGRPRMGLVPTVSCLVNTIENPDYTERGLAVKIVLTQEKEYLEILEDGLRSSGDLEKGQRVLTPDDAALLFEDVELRALASAAAGPSGTMVIHSVPSNAYGQDMVAHVKHTLKEQLQPLAEHKGPTQT